MLSVIVVIISLHLSSWRCVQGHGHRSRHGRATGCCSLGDRIADDHIQLVVLVTARLHRLLLLVLMAWLLEMACDAIPMVAVVAIVVGIHTAATHAIAMAEYRRRDGRHTLATLVADPRTIAAHRSVAGSRRRHWWGGRRGIRGAARPTPLKGPGNWARDLHSHGSRDREPQWVTFG